jgi:hypothetical protein
MVGMVGLAAAQLLFLIGAVEDFRIAIPFSGLIGAWFVLVALLARWSRRWPGWLTAAAAIAGAGLLLSVLGLWLGTSHPVPQAGYAVGGIAEIVWATAFGLRILLADREPEGGRGERI